MRRLPLLVVGAALVLTGGTFAWTGYADPAGAVLWISAGMACVLLSNGRPS